MTLATRLAGGDCLLTVFPAVVTGGVFMPGIDRCLEGPAVLDQERRVRHDEPGRTPGEGGLKRYAHLFRLDRIG
jgi:hypothetical protein